MRNKTPHQVAELQTAEDLAKTARARLYAAGEPNLALRLSALIKDIDLTRLEARIRHEVEGTNDR